MNERKLTAVELKQIAMRVKDDIDAASVAEFQDDPRSHMGASVIGHECSAYVWLSFRWVKHEIFGGRMLRLFNRGHEEEHKIIKWLRKIGFEVHDRDAEGKQYVMAGARGHYGGSNDSIVRLPYLEYRDEPWLAEYKTHNTKSFTHLVSNGLKISKPRHYAQMCAYGDAWKIRYGLYCAVNKNDDDMHFEAVELDWSFGRDLYKRAEDMIFSKIMPPKISLQPSHKSCKYCVFSGVCHEGEMPTKNCRSCAFASPVDNGQWQCERYGIIPKEFLPKGCNDWKSLI